MKSTTSEELLPLLNAGTSVERVHLTELDVNCISRITFSWLSTVLKHGAIAPLELDDLNDVAVGDDAFHVYQQLQSRVRNNEVNRSTFGDKQLLWVSIRQV
jgi:hypothetical protein